MDETESPRGDVAIMTLLVGALTGQHELTDDERKAIGEWLVDHADEEMVRNLLAKIVGTQIGDTSEFRVKVAEAIREKFQSPGDPERRPVFWRRRS